MITFTGPERVNRSEWENSVRTTSRHSINVERIVTPRYTQTPDFVKILDNASELGYVLENISRVKQEKGKFMGVDRSAESLRFANDLKAVAQPVKKIEQHQGRGLGL